MISFATKLRRALTFLETAGTAQGRLKRVSPIPMSWPDSKKVNLDDDAPDEWIAYIGKYTAESGRTFTVQVTRNVKEKDIAWIDGLSSDNSSGTGSFQEIIPALQADLEQLGVKDVKWEAAMGNFNRKSKAKPRERTPEQEQAIRDRLFNHLKSRSAPYPKVEAKLRMLAAILEG